VLQLIKREITMADTRERTNTWSELIEMPQHQVLQVVLLGAGLGFFAWAVGLLVRHIVFVPLFCGDPTSSMCLSAPDASANVAAIITAIVGLLGLVRLSIYRPLIVAVAVLLSLWGFGGWTNGFLWYESLAWAILLYALCYTAFSWLVRPRSFIPALALVLVAVILVRWLPTI
jgi:hypothetical protein